MGRMNTKENGGRGFGGKGFYAALALCLVGTGVTAWIAVNSTVKDLEEEPGSESLEPLTSKADTLTPQEILDLNREAESQWSSPSLQEADTKSDDVPVTSQAEDTQDSSSTASSSAQSSDSSSVSSGSAEEPAQSVSSQNVLYMLPVSGDIIGTFSGGELVKNPTMGDWRTHDGLDLAVDLGTKVIASAAQTAAAHLQRSTDFLARYGGEEFIALLMGDSSEKAFEHLKRIRQAVEDLHIPHDPSVSEWVTISIGGVTVVPKADSSYAVSLKVADTMLYDAKNHGRNRVVWADERMRQLWEKKPDLC